MQGMALSASLLARISLVLSTASAVSVGVVACGQTTDGGTGTSGGAGGTTGTGGTGGTTTSGGTGGSGVGGSGVGGSGVGGGGVGGTGVGGTTATCQRPLPANNPQACHDTAECQAKSGMFSTCFPPGKSSCDGLSGPGLPTCETDDDCTKQSPEWICQPQSYGQTTKLCSSKCQGGSCGPSLSCNAGTGRCETISCATSACPAETFCNDANVCAYQLCNATRGCAEGFACSPTTFTCAPTTCTGQTAGECPAQFSCDAATKTCARLPCACDTECPSNGYCSAGACYQEPSHCDGGCAIGRPLIVGEGEVLVAALVRGDGTTAWA